MMSATTLAMLPLTEFGLAAESFSRPRTVGILLFGLSPSGPEATAFRQGIRDAGYTEGQDIFFEWRAAEGEPTRLAGLAAQLVKHPVDCLVVESTVAALAAQRATASIPIVLAFVADPVGSGLVQSLARPGRNVTGLSNMTGEITTKRLQLLKEVFPRAKRVGVLWNPDTPWHQSAVEQLKAASLALGVQLDFVPARSSVDLDSAFSALVQRKAEALLVIDAPFTGIHASTIASKALKAHLPVVYSLGRLGTNGALIGYGPDARDLFSRAARYVDRVLKGADPAQLPVEQPTKFKLVINLKTAKALGITIPESILLRADEIIK
jgi:putative ABC transport system substrate-binding protein